MNYAEIVYNFERKYERGFLQSEIDILLCNYPNANLKKFNDALFGCTCEIIDNQELIYVIDVYHAFKCAIENRNLENHELD